METYAYTQSHGNTPVNAHQPVVRGEGFLQVLQFDVLVTNLYITCAVKATRLAIPLATRRGIEEERGQGIGKGGGKRAAENGVATNQQILPHKLFC